MSKPDTWLPWYVSDFLVDTTKLNDAETGSYALLLMHLWISDGSLPDDDDDLARYARCDPRVWPKRRLRLAKFFDIRDGFWRQKRLTEELTKATHVYETKVGNGRKGGRPPKQKGTGKVTEQKPAGSVSLNRPGNLIGNRIETQSQVHSTVTKEEAVTVEVSTAVSKNETSVETKTKVAALPLPEWLPPETWEAFKRHRAACKAKLSVDAHNLTLRELTKLHDQGQDPVASIEQSIARGWKGVFAVKNASSNGLSAAGAKTVSNLSDWRPPEDKDAKGH